MISSKAPLVSIIIPCYKAEKELPEALNSISQQEYKNWEIIVVNDGWPDRTEAIVKDFGKKHPSHSVVFLKHAKNAGLGQTRNTGIAAAKGDYFAFLDHDDIWETNHLATGIETLVQQNADLYFTTVAVFDSQTNYRHLDWGPTPEDMKNFADSLYGRNFIQPSGVIFTRELSKKLGPMDTHPKIHFCEDHDYWLRALNLQAKFCTSKSITCRYRSNNPAAATTKVAMMIEHNIFVQRKHLNSPVFSRSAKTKAISNNYKNLANFYWKTQHLLSLYLMLRAVYWNPCAWEIHRRFIKGLILWPTVLLKPHKV
jgi:glycosyltransferase involved in cell wall biosynthesis